MSTDVLAAPAAVSTGVRPGLAREANATFAIAWREVLGALVRGLTNDEVAPRSRSPGGRS